MSAISGTEVLAFEGFSLDPRQRRLFGPDGRSLPLSGRAFDTLLYLVEHPNQLIDKQALIKAVWPNVVVEENNLNQNILIVRRVLGETPGENRFIVTVPGRGFRFVPTVSRLDGAADSPSDVKATSTVTGASAAPTGANASGREPPVRGDERPAEVAPNSVSVARATTHAWVWPWVILVVAVAFAIGYPIAQKVWPAKQTTTLEHETTVPAVAISEPSIAVLPFADVSDQRDQEYFADGLSEVLIDRLAMVPGLRVAASTSSSYFKGKQATVPEIGKALGVAHLLEGTVTKSGNRLRITARLVHAENGYQIWADTFDRPPSDVLKIQDDIAGAVVQVLKVSILATHGVIEPALRTTNVEAYTMYFRAESNVVSNGVADYDAAAEQLRSAVTLDPQFAAAWARLALVTIWKFDVARAPGAHAIGPAPTGTACASARAAADRALEVDATLVTSHRAKGVVLQYCDNNWLAAESEFRRALELQPGSSDALRSYAWLALAVGRPAQALQLAHHALSLDPLNPWNFAALGDASLTVGRMADAEAAYSRAAELNPATAGLHALLADILLITGKGSQAVAEAEQEPDTDWREAVLPFALDAAGRNRDADRAIALYESKHPDDAGRIAAFYACRHNTEPAIQWLKSFATKHEGEYHDLPYEEGCLKNVESDARYQALLRKMKAQRFEPLPAKRSIVS